MTEMVNTYDAIQLVLELLWLYFIYAREHGARAGLSWAQAVYLSANRFASHTHAHISHATTYPAPRHDYGHDYSRFFLATRVVRHASITISGSQSSTLHLCKHPPRHRLFKSRRRLSAALKSSTRSAEEVNGLDSCTSRAQERTRCGRRSTVWCVCDSSSFACDAPESFGRTIGLAAGRFLETFASTLEDAAQSCPSYLRIHLRSCTCGGTSNKRSGSAVCNG